MKFAGCIGGFELVNFVELGVRSWRRIFGQSPLILYCGAGPNAQHIKDIADQFGCSFVSEATNRKHWAGCLQSAVVAVAFARANDCDIALKLNQRTILLSEDIPELIEEVFADKRIDLAMPQAVRAETILDDKSKFHAKFVVSPDCIAMRQSAIDPQWLADTYAEQVRTNINRYAAFTEEFWRIRTEKEFAGRWKALEFMREPTEPPMYLRKIQHSPSDYNRAALALGMSAGNFDTQEWSALLRGGYRPMPTV